MRKVKPFKNRAFYFPPHLWVVKCLKFLQFVKDNHTNRFTSFLSMEHQLFRYKTWAIVYLKTHASWINRRRDKESWNRYWTKKEVFSGPAVQHMCHIVYNQTWTAGLSFGRWLSKPAGKASRQELTACTLTFNNAWTGLCTYLINGSAACFSPKLAGALLNVFLDSLPKIQLAASSQ